MNTMEQRALKKAAEEKAAALKNPKPKGNPVSRDLKAKTTKSKKSKK